MVLMVYGYMVYVHTSTFHFHVNYDFLRMQFFFVHVSKASVHYPKQHWKI